MKMKSNRNQLNSSTKNLTVIRKTSAEIVSEAKNMLATCGGTRLVSTKRPQTPREPRRQLYGKLAPPGRPPSSFSLRYLQYESRALPNLDPLGSNTSASVVPRSESIGTIVELQHGEGTNNVPMRTDSVGKLPALLSAPKIAASLDNLSEGMPPRKDFKLSKEIDAIEPSDEIPNKQSFKCNAMKLRLTRSFDGNMPIINQREKEKIINKSNALGSTKKRLTKTNDILAQSSTDTLLDMLKAHAGIKESTDETILHINGILAELYTRIKGAKGNWRGAILGAVYGLVECNSPKVLLSVARVVFALCVTGSNLTGACKLVFKIARSEVNDALFVDSDVPELLIEGLGRASPTEDAEACIYGYGAVRFLATAVLSVPSPDAHSKLMGNKSVKQKTLAQRLARHGAIQLMILHLQILNEAGAVGLLNGQPLHALYQLSAAMRALAGTQSIIGTIAQPPPSLFTGSHSDSNRYPMIQETPEKQDIQLDLATPHLIRAAECCINEPEVQGNLIRTLSILSENEKCCEAMSQHSGRIGILLGPCGKNCGSQVSEKSLGMVSRLGYILGNIMGKHDSSRIQFYDNDVAMQYLTEALDMYANQQFTRKNQTGDSVLDVLIKLVRVIANMGVNPTVGYELGIRVGLGHVLLTLLVTINHQPIPFTSELEELLLAVLGALHNLSYYQNVNEEMQTTLKASSMIERLGNLSTALYKTITLGTVTVQAEAARVLGNMTKSSVARDSFCSAGGMKLIIKCLESEELELIATSCGVLVNLLADWEKRAPFRELGGSVLLRDALQHSANDSDWLLACIVCQAFWNYLIDSENVINSLGEDEADYLVADLAEYLDEETIFNGEPPDPLWEQFATVATDLLERIQSCISYSNSPCPSSDEDENLPIAQIGNKWKGKFNQWLQQE